MFKTNLLDPGTVYDIAGRRYLCRGRGPGGRLRLDDLQRKVPLYLTPERLNDHLLDGTARALPPSILDELSTAPQIQRQMPGDLASLPPAVQEAARRRAHYVRAVLNAGPGSLTNNRLTPIIEKARKTRGDTSAPSWRSLVRWVHAYERGGTVLALVAERRGNGHSRICMPVQEKMEQAVEDCFLTLSRRSLKSVLFTLNGRIDQENELLPDEQQLPRVSYRSLRRFVLALDRFEVMARRYGETYARRWFRAYKKGAIASRPLELVLVDHTILDVEVAYLGLLRLGRPTITVMMDLYTRMIVAIHISFEPPSYVCVMEALRMCILPKDELIRDLQARGIVKNDWPAFGVPECLILDNGKEFRGRDLQNAAAHFGMDLRFSPPRKPWFKGAIERFLLTLKDSLVAALPNRTFPIKEIQPEEKISAPVIDLEDLRTILVKWVVDIYHQTPHRSNGLTPAAMFEYAKKGTTWF